MVIPLLVNGLMMISLKEDTILVTNLKRDVIDLLIALTVVKMVIFPEIAPTKELIIVTNRITVLAITADNKVTFRETALKRGELIIVFVIDVDNQVTLCEIALCLIIDSREVVIEGPIVKATTVEMMDTLSHLIIEENAVILIAIVSLVL